MDGSRARVATVFGVAFLGGAGTMVVELAAVRLLAPWFGTSLAVWTNVIAVVLLGLALGYLAGARLAGREGVFAWLALVLGAAGLCGAFLPLGARALAPLFLPEAAALDEAAELVGWGSLALALLLFLVPCALLGTVAPLAAQALQSTCGGSAGRAGGLVLGVSTLGSLVGVFSTSHVLLPELGLEGTFLVAGASLALAGLLAGIVGRGAGRWAALALVGACASSLVPARHARVQPGIVELASVESPYQSIRVVASTGPDSALGIPGGRSLQVNEGFDSFQSVWQPEPGFLPPGFYYNFFAFPLWWEQRSGDWSVLVLGMGAGTALRVLEGAHPAGVVLSCVGIEIDPWVVALGREHMGLADGERTILGTGLDARVALRARIGPFDQVVLDCYANQIEIPPHLATLEFFRELRGKMARGAWLTANLGGFGFDDPVVATVARSAARAFEDRVLVLRVPQSRNFVLVARNGGALPLDERGSLRLVDGPARALMEPLALPGGLELVEPGASGLLLTDDRAPLERLQLASIRTGKARLLSCGARP